MVDALDVSVHPEFDSKSFSETWDSESSKERMREEAVEESKE